MPIDPSIPLQVQPLKLESPVNQLTMMNEAMKYGEMNRSIDTQNKLRELYSQGIDIGTPEGFKQVAALDPATALKLRTQGLETKKLEGDIKKTGLEIDAAQRIGAVQRITSAPDANTAARIIQASMADGSVPEAHGNDLLKQLSTMKYPDWQMNMIRSVVQPKDRYTHETVSAGETARLKQSAAQHADVQNRPQYMQTDAGLVALPNVLKPGQAPVGTMVTGPGGENLSRPLKEIPPAVNKAIIENDISLNKANRALDLLQGKDVTTPKGDVIKGSADATGFWKGLTPQVILNKWDPGGVSTRAFVADIGSLKVHDRSGAAVTASETPRLKPFIPSIYDSPEVAAEKLINFKAEYEDIQRGLTETYSREQGYRPSPVLSGKGSGGGNKPSLDSIFNPKQ